MNAKHKGQQSNAKGGVTEADTSGQLKSKSLRKISASPLRILLVDDEQEVRDSLALLLSFDGHHVTKVGSGKAALEVLGHSPVDLLLTDYRMPGMNGDELARIVKTRHPNLPMIMLSGFGPRELGPLNPVRMLLEKPCQISDLRSALSKCRKGPGKEV